MLKVHTHMINRQREHQRTMNLIGRWQSAHPKEVTITYRALMTLIVLIEIAIENAYREGYKSGVNPNGFRVARLSKKPRRKLPKAHE